MSSCTSAAASNTEQTARMLAALGELLRDEAPDAVLVYGDTNSTLAGALAAAQAQIPVAHVEAGMRSFDRAMPEEINRVLTDHLSALLLAPSQVAAQNLARESVAGARRGRRRRHGRRRAACSRRARAPTTRRCSAPASRRRVRAGDGASRRHGRRPAAPRAARRAAARASSSRSCCRCTRARARGCRPPGCWPASRPATIVLPPLGYLAFTSLLTRARAVLTDSGGVQKEAYLAGVPCVTLRDTTEWVETVEAGWNVLVDLDAGAALAALDARAAPAERPELYGDGHAGRPRRGARSDHLGSQRA